METRIDPTIVRIGNLLFDLSDFAHAEALRGTMCGGTNIWLKSRAGTREPYAHVDAKLYEIEAAIGEALARAKTEAARIPVQ